MNAVIAPLLAPGSQIYKYQLVNPLGQGQFGQVWLADEMALGCRYAIKILNPGIPVDQRLREAQIGHRLDHNNLVQVHQADVIPFGNDHVVIIAMEYLPAGSIVRRVNPANFLPLSEVLRAAKDVLQGLDYLHANNFYHNDIKPENILVGQARQAMLTDYGIVGVSTDGNSVPAPASYLLHKAPEVISGGNINVQTDIFQAGLTLFRLATGLSSLSAMQAQLGWNNYYQAINTGALITADSFPSFIPTALRRIILKAIDPNPAGRFQTPLEMRRAVEKLAFAGSWTVDSSGELVGLSNRFSFRFAQTRVGAGFSVTSFKKNLKSGNETKVSDYCGRGLSAKQADKLVDRFVKHVVTG